MDKAERGQAVKGAQNSRQTAAGARKEATAIRGGCLEEAACQLDLGKQVQYTHVEGEGGGTQDRGKSRSRGAEKTGIFKTSPGRLIHTLNTQFIQVTQGT